MPRTALGRRVRRFCLLVLLGIAGGTPVSASRSSSSGWALGRVSEIFSDVRSAADFRYDLKDDTGTQMDCLHVDAILGDKSIWGGHGYLGLYHANANGQYSVRLASSPDMMSWTYRRTVVSNADMPFLKRVDKGQDGWLLLAHEQWMNPGSRLPSRLGFKLFYNESQLLHGDHFNSYIAPLSVGQQSQLEGTPSIYTATRSTVKGLVVVSADIGFHFNNDEGIDTVASSTLESFGPTVLVPRWNNPHEETRYNRMFIDKGAIGNIGQRAPGTISSMHISLQEANIGKMPPTIWADWRTWIYHFAPGEGAVPSGASGSSASMLNITTHRGSTAIGNPSWHAVPCPSAAWIPGRNADLDCVFVSYFVFSEGAAPGEAGVLAFVKPLPADDGE